MTKSLNFSDIHRQSNLAKTLFFCITTYFWKKPFPQFQCCCPQAPCTRCPRTTLTIRGRGNSWFLPQFLSEVIAFSDILFALSQIFNSFKSWLMPLFIFFSNLSETSIIFKMMYITILDSFVKVIYVNKKQERTQDISLRDSIIGIRYMHFLKTNYLELCAVAVPLNTSWTTGIQFLLCHNDSIY